MPNRFEKTAARIAAHFGVDVKWMPDQREYLVDGTIRANTARQTCIHAQGCARIFAAAAGAGNSYRPSLY